MVSVANRKTSTGFGRRLRALREAMGWTQAELGEKAGMPYQMVARFERGEREPSWGTAIKLADALGAKLDDFRDEPDPPRRKK